MNNVDTFKFRSTETQVVPRSKVTRDYLNFPNRGARVISESGLYRLLMRSDKPAARPFQDWVTREVLPAIRKTGGYLLNEEARDTAKADDRQGMPLPEVFTQSGECFGAKMFSGKIKNQAAQFPPRGVSGAPGYPSRR